jgi:hypothetical protein
MPEPTQTLREVSSQLYHQVESVRALADSVGTAPVSDIRAGLDRLDALVSTQLLTHISSLRDAIGDTENSSLEMDLSQLGSLADEVSWLRKRLGKSAMTVGTANAVRRVLYGLYALLKLHFEKEDAIYLPLVEDAIAPGAAEQEAG